MHPVAERRETMPVNNRILFIIWLISLSGVRLGDGRELLYGV
jgi:hypothetical protein